MLRLVALAAGGMLVAAWALDAAFPFPHAALSPDPARVVVDRNGAVLRIALPADDRYRLPVALDEVAPDMVRTLLASEDRWFYWHPGINPAAVLRATIANLRAGGIVSGASTLPMQIARMAEPRARTVPAKLIEMARALQLEWHYSKSELLEFYLNMTPYGGNLEGVGAAAAFYFDKAPSQLSVGESALLTALPRSPVRYDPVRFPDAAEAARNRVINQLLAHDDLSPADAADARLQPIPRRRRPPPFEAPHAAAMALGRLPGEPRIQTTIDLGIQRTVQSRLRARIDELRAGGVGNLAAVVIDNATSEILALSGSAAFFDPAFQGQVNSATARRSPGSTLKPFLYGLAIDQGLIGPDTYLLDVPTDFAGYVAENYDGTYRGKVTAAQALAQSLNAPAVRLLARTGLDRFHDLLRRGGLETIDQPAAHYGLPLILGAAEVRLVDLVGLYATLARGGIHLPTRLLPAGAEVTGQRLLSPEAAWLITDALREVQRPDFPEAWSLTRQVPDIAWKTGTSYGHRDAWAVGFSARHSIGVWVGNPDGSPRQGISGSRHAGPLLFDLFRAISAGGKPLQKPAAVQVAETRVCSDSHQLASPFCPNTTTIRTIPGVTRLHACEIHRRVFIAESTGQRVAGSCLRDGPHRAVVLAVQPAELTAWKHAQGQGTEQVPPWSPACRDVPPSDAPAIVSPASQTPYVVRADAPLDHQNIPLTARVGTESRRLYWYQDGKLIAAAAPDARVFVPPSPGEHEMVVVDDAGRVDTVRYRVEGRSGR